jgi:hypothetical protein
MLHAHIGWIVFKQDKNDVGRVDISDLNNDPIVHWQNRHYVAVALTMAFAFPCVVAGLGWGDWKGGLIYAGILRLCVVQQATFCVNSLAHCKFITFSLRFLLEHSPISIFISFANSLIQGSETNPLTTVTPLETT